MAAYNSNGFVLVDPRAVYPEERKRRTGSGLAAIRQPKKGGKKVQGYSLSRATGEGASSERSEEPHLTRGAHNSVSQRSV